MAAQVLAQPKRTRNDPMQPRAGLQAKEVSRFKREDASGCSRIVSVFRGSGFQLGWLVLGGYDERQLCPEVLQQQTDPKLEGSGRANCSRRS